MSELVVQENDPFLTSDVVVEILKQLRAIDTYDTYDGLTEAQIIDPLILTKERRREIPIVGDPDEITLARVKVYYNAIATLVEKKTKLMAVPVINITHEGFGRAFVLTGKLIVVDKVELKNGVIAKYQIVAPTEWNFQSNGVATLSLQSLSARDKTTLRHHATLIINAIDRVWILN